MKGPHISRKFRFKHLGFNVTMTVLAYREVDDEFARSCAFDYKRITKRLTSDVEVIRETSYGISDPI
jgi:hypothetical protein